MIRLVLMMFLLMGCASTPVPKPEVPQCPEAEEVSCIPCYECCAYTRGYSYFRMWCEDELEAMRELRIEYCGVNDE